MKTINTIYLSLILSITILTSSQAQTPPYGIAGIQLGMSKNEVETHLTEKDPALSAQWSDDNGQATSKKLACELSGTITINNHKRQYWCYFYKDRAWFFELALFSYNENSSIANLYNEIKFALCRKYGKYDTINETQTSEQVNWKRNDPGPVSLVLKAINNQISLYEIDYNKRDLNRASKVNAILE